MLSRKYKPYINLGSQLGILSMNHHLLSPPSHRCHTEIYQKVTHFPLPYMGQNIGCLYLGAIKISGGYGLKAKGRMNPCDVLACSRNLKYSWCSRHFTAAIMPTFFHTTITLLLGDFESVKILLAGYATTPCKWGVNKSRQILQHTPLSSTPSLNRVKLVGLPKDPLSDFIKRYSLLPQLQNTLLRCPFWLLLNFIETFTLKNFCFKCDCTDFCRRKNSHKIFL